jgi:hypothetical protein
MSAMLPCADISQFSIEVGQGPEADASWFIRGLASGALIRAMRCPGDLSENAIAAIL